MQYWLTQPLSRGRYAACIIGLVLFKYAVEAVVIFAVTNAFYTPWAFALPLLSWKSPTLMVGPSWVGASLLGWTLPFLFVGLLLSVRRALDAGISPWTAFWILCPLVNIPFMLVMTWLPSACRVPGDELDMIGWSPGTTTPVAANPHLVSGEATAEGVRAVMWGLTLGAATLAISIYLLGQYGVALFLVTPILMSAITTHEFQSRTQRGLSACLALSLFCMTCALGLTLALALEGLLCVIMAAPIAYGGSLIGTLLGYAIAGAANVRRGYLPAVVILPVMWAMEQTLLQPTLIEVTSSVEIDATSQQVWPHVIAFTPITAPPTGLLAWGIAYPQSARIEGAGVGAVRYCEFSTGAFVEPITTWDPPQHLAFDVVSQPCPMRELSPYRDIHPPHLDGFLKSHRGEFRLIDLPSGGMRLEGHTWYTVDMLPHAYWQWWSDHIIHSIHLRVLEHIKRKVEQKPGRPS